MNIEDQEFRAFVEHSPDHIIWYDRELRRTYVNGAVSQAYGLSSERLVGKALGEGLDATTEDRRRIEIQRIGDYMRKVLETGEPQDHQVTLTSSSGRRHYHTRIIARRDTAGNIVGVFAIGRDVTASRETERQLRSLAENSPDLIVRFGKDGRFQYVNHAVEKAGWIAAADLRDRRVGDLAAERTGPIPKTLLRARATVEEVARTGIPARIEVAIPVENGTELLFDCRILPERDELGEVATVLLIGQDVTERKHSEEARRQLVGELMRARDEERGAVAHQLHNEVGQSVLALLFGLERIVRLNDLPEAKAHAERLRKMAADTLEGLRRLAHGLHSTALVDLGLVPAIEQCALEYRASFGLPVDLAVEGSVAERLAKPIEAGLYRIVLQALMNVVRHARASRASIVLSRKSTSVDLIVEDDGVGFDPEALLAAPGAPRAFGLRGILETASLLGGVARIESTPGSGTTVAVRIPLADR